MKIFNDVIITGTLYATSKSFLIKHPLRPSTELKHGSLEGPENGIYVRGRLINDYVIDLPDYWRALVDETTITVQLTPIGWSQKLWVNSIEDNKVFIKTSIFTKINCFYLVLAERKDIPKLKVE